MELMGRVDLNLIFRKCVLRRFRHFLLGMFVYRDTTSRLLMFVLWTLMSLSLLRISVEFIMWAGLMVPNRGVRILEMTRAIL